MGGASVRTLFLRWGPEGFELDSGGISGRGARGIDVDGGESCESGGEGYESVGLVTA